MLETKDLISDKAKQSDWKAMYKNVWSHEESAKYMYWSITTNEDDAKVRIKKTIEFQKTHDTYLVYDKATKEAIGFAGVEKLDSHTCGETGICLGPDFVGKGYGKQIVLRLMKYCKEELGAKEFIYLTREKNEASKGLAESLGFKYFDKEERIDERNNEIYIMLKYRLKL